MIQRLVYISIISGFEISSIEKIVTLERQKEISTMEFHEICYYFLTTLLISHYVEI